jgi:hypothetical protein
MELVAAALLAGPFGLFARTRRAGLIGYLIVWAIVFPTQTVVVNGENPTTSTGATSRSTA